MSSLRAASVSLLQEKSTSGDYVGSMASEIQGNLFFVVANDGSLSFSKRRSLNGGIPTGKCCVRYCYKYIMLGLLK